MAKVGNEKQYLPFVKGLITEASPLTFPEGATLDEDNFVLNRDGSRQRRLGLEVDPDAIWLPVTTDYSATSYHEWPLAGGSDITLGVVRINSKLYFLDMTVDSPTLHLKNQGNAIEFATLSDGRIDVTSINNSLILVSSSLPYPLLFEYDSVTDTVSYQEIEIKVRDFWGVTSRDDYNKLNQGGVEPTEWVQPPNGKYILDIYNRGTSRQSASSITGLPQDTEQGKLSVVTSFAGRIFYSGIQSSVLGKDVDSPNFSGYIFFTQTINKNSKLGLCYQEADPTSEIPDIVDTDGGTIHIPEAVKIVKVLGVKSSLIIFAENGIWEIYAGDTGFRATEYQLNKISNVGIINKDTIVEANDTVVFWSKFGIYVLVPNQVTGRFEVQNISLPTIQSFYLSIPEQAKKNAKGFYEEEQGRIRWLYSATFDVDFPNKYNKELILDQTLQAFYPHSASINNQWITDYIKIPNYILNTDEDTVYVGTSIVLVGTEEVTSEYTSYISRDTKFNFLTISPSFGFTTSGYTARTFLDWGADNYSSYLLTGYELFGDFLRRKQVPYILFYFKKTEDGFDDVTLELENQSSCLVQAQWSWTNSANAGKWGTSFQAYRFNRNYIMSGPTDPFDTGEHLVYSKNRLRGSGKSLSLKIYSEEGKDMHIYGWGLNMHGRSRI